MEAPGFWDDTEKSQNMMKELKTLKDGIEGFKAPNVNATYIGQLYRHIP